jgi:hypothetical protein
VVNTNAAWMAEELSRNGHKGILRSLKPLVCK